MAGGRETLNLVQSETSEFMDQPASVQRDHVVVTVIPPARDASSTASSSAAAAAGFQTSNSPHGALPTADVVSTSGAAANTPPPGRRSGGAPQQQPRSSSPRRRPWRNSCVFNLRILDLCSTSIQIILLVVFLVFRDEHPQVALRVWAIGYGVGCVAMLPLLCCTLRFERRLPREAQSWNQLLLEAFFTIAGALAGTQELANESPTLGRRLRRCGKILDWLWISVDGFFTLWFLVGSGIVDMRSVTGQAPSLNRLCTGFLIFSYFRFILKRTIEIVVRHCGEPLVLVPVLPVLRERPPPGARANVISALPTHKFQVPNFGGGDEPRVAAADQVVEECCICLDPYEEGVELKELPCSHSFHVKCIDQWLKINGSCPICKGEVGGTSSSKASATETAFMTITVMR